MTNKNDEHNWVVLALMPPNPAKRSKGGPRFVCHDQAENIAKQAAEKFASENPGVAVCLYQRVTTVRTVTSIKWE